MTEARLLAECGSFALIENGAELRFVDRGFGGSYTALFVLGLVGAIFTLQGVVFTIMRLGGDDELPWVLGPITLALGTTMFTVFRLLWLRMKRLRNRNPLELRPVLVLDRTRQIAYDEEGRPWGALCNLRFRKRVQFGSSSPALACLSEGRSIVVARGNPFAFGSDISDVALSLKQRGAPVDGF